MNISGTHALEAILRYCAEATPKPWYPSAYAQSSGISRDSLDPFLDQLRMSGLIQLTEWVAGSGQGYVLTPLGIQAMDNPKFMAQVRTGHMPMFTYRPLLKEVIPEGRSTVWERGEAARDALLNRYSVPRVTFTLIFINVLVFLWGMALASSRNVPLSDYLAGGDKNGQVRSIQQTIGFLRGKDCFVHDEWWRLLTACFGHIGFIHLLVNMYSLYAVGPLLERLWGAGPFLILYLIAGLGGSCGMLIENPLGGGAGASGAIWGILASLVTWIYLNREALPSSLISDWRRQLIAVFVLNLFITFYIPEISKGGHFGGGLIGLLTGVPLDYLRFGRGLKRKLGFIGLVAIPCLCLAILWGYFQYSDAFDVKLLRELRRQTHATVWISNTSQKPLLTDPTSTSNAPPVPERGAEQREWGPDNPDRARPVREPVRPRDRRDSAG
jgi:membrane associated rhomboid family serine protease